MCGPGLLLHIKMIFYSVKDAWKDQIFSLSYILGVSGFTFPLFSHVMCTAEKQVDNSPEAPLTPQPFQETPIHITPAPSDWAKNPLGAPHKHTSQSPGAQSPPSLQLPPTCFFQAPWGLPKRLAQPQECEHVCACLCVKNLGVRVGLESGGAKEAGPYREVQTYRGEHAQGITLQRIGPSSW